MKASALWTALALVTLDCGAPCELDTDLPAGEYRPVPDSSDAFENERLELSTDRQTLTDSYDLDGHHYEVTYRVVNLRSSH